MEGLVLRDICSPYKTLIDDRFVVVDETTGALYRKLNRPNLSQGEIQHCKRMSGNSFRGLGGSKSRGNYKKNFRQRSQDIVKRKISNSRKVKGDRTRYRAFVVDNDDGSCSELNRMLDEICRISDEEEFDGDEGEYFDMVREDGDLDGYLDGGIGGKSSWFVNAFRSEHSQVLNKVEKEGKRSIFEINFAVHG